MPVVFINNISVLAYNAVEDSKHKNTWYYSKLLTSHFH